MPVKILLADKSITIQKVVEMLFAGREYEVVCVSDGEAALKEAERTSPDAVLADVDLPLMDGYRFAETLKKNPALAQTPVILMMSRDDVYDNAKGKQAGIADKIVKPFESQELISKVKKAVAAAPVRPAKPATAAPQSLVPKELTAPAAVRQTSAAPQNIFDIIQEAPSQADFKPATVSSMGESVYEVEPVVEEVEATLFPEEEEALPTGSKAVEEMRESLGLIDKKTPLRPHAAETVSPEKETDAEKKFAAPPKKPAAPEIVDFGSLDIPTDAEKIFASPKEAVPPASVDFESLDMAKEAEQLFVPPQEGPSPELVSFETLDMARDTEQLFAPPQAAATPDKQPGAAPTLSEEELRNMAEQTISKMAVDVFKNMPLPTPPKISEDTVRSMAEEAIAKMAADVFKDMPLPAPPKISEETIRRGLQEAVLKVAREMAREVIEQVAWEVIPQLAETLLQEEIERFKAKTQK